MHSILKAFESQPTIDLVSPGLTFEPTSQKMTCFLTSEENISNQIYLCFRSEDVDLMQRLCTQLGPEACPYFDKYLVCATRYYVWAICTKAVHGPSSQAIS